MEIAQNEMMRLDGPTLGAAATSVMFAVSGGMLLGHLPVSETFGSAIEALKNLVYVLAVPVFDIARRVFSSRRRAADAHGTSPNLLTGAFVSALILFVLIEILSFLMGMGVGGLCIFLGQAVANLPVGNCIQLGIGSMALTIIIPISIALGLGCGWTWQRYSGTQFLLTLVMFSIVIVLLFSLDYLIFLQTPDEEGIKPFADQMRGSPLAVIGGKLAILAPSITIGYWVGKGWTAVARAFG